MITNPTKAIRAFCLECCGNSSNEVKLCPRTICPLYSFRFGKNPHRKRRELTEEERQVLRDRLNKVRNSPSNSAEEIDFDYGAEDD